MILSFGNKVTDELYNGLATKGVSRLPQEIIQKTLNKLDVLNGAHDLLDLRSPPGNRLEALKGDFAGFYSIRVNDQWRIIFRWKDGNAYEVQLTDYH
ncbi:MAG: type II toxin-antitoxin system RelE/ParE family toxin [Deltaproteobacteria bacterium]|nr:type II toxin-antitoxin system RelE/ParE family toxin [Deltaproteobacteria bacterium]